MYYELQIESGQRVVVSLFQEDELDSLVQSQRPFTDLSLVVLSKSADNSLQLYNYFDYQYLSYQHFIIDLPPGNYILYPRTQCQNIFSSIPTPSLSIDFTDLSNPQLLSFLKNLFNQLDLYVKGYLNLEDLLNLKHILQININPDIFTKYFHKYSYIKFKIFNLIFVDIVQQ